MGEYLFIASAIFSIVNGTVLLCVNQRRLINRAFFATSVWMALWFLCIVFAVQSGQEVPFESTPVVFWIRAGAVISAFSIWLIWVMKSILLEDRLDAVNLVRQSWPWLAVSLALALIALSESFILSTSTPENKGRRDGYIAYALIAVICWMALLLDALQKSRHLRGVRRVEMQFFVIGAICACLLVISSHMLGLFLDVSWLRHSSSVWFLMLHGITVWAVCHHRVFDAKQVILSIGQRLLLLAFVGFSALTLHQLLCQFIDSFWSLLWAATFACAVGITLDSHTRRWIGLDIQLRLAAPRQQIIDWAREVPSEDELRENFANLFRDQCQTSSVLFLPSTATAHNDLNLTLASDWPGFVALCKDGWTTPETLQRSRAGTGTRECVELMLNQKLGALLAVPKGSRPPSLVIGLGQKESLRPYTFPDMQVLLDLAELMDNILTHSRVATDAACIERMISATMISRGLAHDLNNLATPVSAFLIHMEGKVTPGTTEAIVLDDAKASIRVMQDYIQESLFFARRLVPSLALIDAHSLLKDVVRVSLERARHSAIQVVIRNEPNLTFVADLSLLRRLLQNLVFNGIDASANGSTIEISAILTEDQQICLQVADQGSGVPVEIRNRIFEPYYTTKDADSPHRGLGLGLAICQKIAELHEGRISVSANSPHGTVFTTRLPKKNAVPALPPTANEKPISQGRQLSESIQGFGPHQPINGT